MESGRPDFAVHAPGHLSGGYNFTSYCLPPRNKSGGILLGIKTSYMDLLDFSDVEFHIKFCLLNKDDNFTWSIVVVYGAS